jgi:hypothetical protein
MTRAFGSPKTRHTAGSGRKPGKQYASHSRRLRFARPAIHLECQIAEPAVIQNRGKCTAFFGLQNLNAPTRFHEDPDFLRPDCSAWSRSWHNGYRVACTLKTLKTGNRSGDGQ